MQKFVFNSIYLSFCRRFCLFCLGNGKSLTHGNLHCARPSDTSENKQVNAIIRLALCHSLHTKTGFRSESECRLTPASIATQNYFYPNDNTNIHRQLLSL